MEERTGEEERERERERESTVVPGGSREVERVIERGRESDRER